MNETETLDTDTDTETTTAAAGIAAFGISFVLAAAATIAYKKWSNRKTAVVVELIPDLVPVQDMD